MPVVEEPGIIERITELTERAATGTEIEIVEIQLRGAGKSRLLRVYIDKPGGVTHGDCETISHNLSALLDEQDAVPGDTYTLEVSSPGAERKLSKPRDFERVIGQKVRVSLREPMEGSKSFEGKLTAVANGALDLEIAAGQSLQVPLERVQKANLKFDW
jgi:ribosome maturation factor RimP